MLLLNIAQIGTQHHLNQQAWETLTQKKRACIWTELEMNWMYVDSWDFVDTNDAKINST